MENKFKFKDEVIVRNHQSNGDWFYAVISHCTDEHYVLCNGTICRHNTYDFLPLEGNEYLIGTKNDPENEALIEIGELCYGFCMMQDLDNYEDIILGKFDGVDKQSEEIFVSNTPVDYCIPYSKFYPYDMESTKKEILTVSTRTHKLVKLK